MRILLFLIIIFFGSSGLFLPKTQQSVAYAEEDTTINAAKEMIAWQQQYGEIINELGSIFSNENMGFLYELDFEDNDATKLALQDYNQNRNAVFARANELRIALPPPERWDIQKSLFQKMERVLYGVMKEQYAELDQLFSEMKIASDFDTIFNEAIEGGSEEVINRLLIKQSESVIKMIEAENSQLDAYLLAIPKDNPNHQFHQIVKAGNIATMHEVEWNLKSIDGEDIKTRQELGKKMKDTISEIPSLIKRGRKNMVSTAKQYEKLIRNPKTTKQQSDFLKIAKNAINTFNTTFDNEEKIMLNMTKTSYLMQSSFLDEEQEEESDQIDQEYLDLIDDRSKTMLYRMSLFNQ